MGLSKQKYPANNGLARVLVNPAQNRGYPRKGHDVVGEYAVYMIPEAARNLLGTGRESSGFGPANLDAPPLSPYTSAVPEMDVILNPRGPRS
jgi:hypothetical protein